MATNKNQDMLYMMASMYKMVDRYEVTGFILD